MRRAALAALWLTATAGASLFLARSLQGDGRRIFLPGETTGGHHQLEAACELCHEPGRGVQQELCLGCHRAELAEADDSHPPIKFMDPRNAALNSKLDARRCVTCHIEHRPGITAVMGVSQPVDFCRTCHEDVVEERPTHRGLDFASCQATGCHNYHDNRALRETYLAEHLGEAPLHGRGTVPALDRARHASLTGAPLRAGQQDAPPGAGSAEHVAEWLASSHARAGVNCTGCHGGATLASAGAVYAGAGSTAWTDRPGPDACGACHADEVEGFARGKHGMRQAAGLGPMRPADARLAMTDRADHRELGCASCHGAHTFDTRRAAVEACLECHDDGHSRSYLGSPHHQRWQLEQDGRYWPGSGVSCATCHLPRVRRVATDRPGVAVLHNQNEALRPVETLVRPVCQSCHGVGFSLAALADRDLVNNNFRGRPAEPAAALEMVERHRAAAAGDLATTPEVQP
jgi:hypothetical protein